jgi:hypothetical protein
MRRNHQYAAVYPGIVFMRSIFLWCKVVIQHRLILEES